MRLLSRMIFREVLVSATLGATLFTFIIFLQKARPLFEFLVRSPGPASQVAYLFALVLPQALPFTIPAGILFATLLTVSRMSSDGEVTAMRAAGVPGRRVLPPLLTFGFLRRGWPRRLRCGWRPGPSASAIAWKIKSSTAD